MLEPINIPFTTATDNKKVQLKSVQTKWDDIKIFIQPNAVLTQNCSLGVTLTCPDPTVPLGFLCKLGLAFPVLLPVEPKYAMKRYPESRKIPLSHPPRHACSEAGHTRGRLLGWPQCNLSDS